MTLLVEDSSKTFIGAGTVGPFTWTWRFFDNDDITAKRISAEGVETALVETTDYTLTGANTYQGGVLTLVEILSVGETLYVERNTPSLQEVDLRNQGDFFPETYEEALDKTVAILQDEGRSGDDSLRYSPPATGVSRVFPAPVAHHLVRFTADALGLESIDVPTLLPGGVVEADLVERVTDIFSLINVSDPDANKAYTVLGFFFTAPESNPKGGGVFTWQEGLNKNLADGTSIVDPATTGGFDGTPSTLTAYFAAQGTGIGNGCWVIIQVAPASATEYATVGANIAGSISLVHAGGSEGTASTSAPIDINTFYRVVIEITTTTSGFVKILFDGTDQIYGDQVDGLYFSTDTILLDGTENNRIMDATTYTLALYTSSVSFSTLSVETDLDWAGTISSIEVAEVVEKPSLIQAVPHDGIEEDYYFGLKHGSRNRNDIAFGDKSALGLKQDDGGGLIGAHNVAVGAKSMMMTEFGDENTAYGTFALQSVEAHNNVGIGYSSLKLCTKGQENTAVGYKSGTNVTTGFKNVFMGFWAGVGVTTGDENVDIGWRSNIAGGNLSKTVRLGSRCGTYLLDGVQNVIIGALAGKSASELATETLNQVTSVGAESNVFGDGSTAFGFQAKVGVEATPADFGIALGANSTVLSDEAIAIGRTSSATGAGSIAIGEGAQTTNSSNCIALGSDAVSGADEGIAIGKSATGTGSRAVSVGGSSSAAGAQTTVVGALSTPAGANNVAVGFRAGNNFNGASNTFLGHTAGIQAVETFVNCTLLGASTDVSASNQVQLGDSATTTFAYGAVQDRSDGRDKTDVKALTDAHIAFFMDIEWRQFRFDYREDYIELVDTGEVDEEGEPIFERVTHEKDGSKARTRFHIGAIAQQVEAAMQKHGIDFAGLQHHAVNGGKDVYTIGYQEFTGIQGEIIQRQQKRLDSIESRLAAAGL